VQERQQLKERQRAIEEAEQARKRAITVTFDLLGRQAWAFNYADLWKGIPQNNLNGRAHTYL
jgi:hypothetical protein